jgi:hypothetical protein
MIPLDMINHGPVGYLGHPDKIILVHAQYRGRADQFIRQRRYHQLHDIAVVDIGSLTDARRIANEQSQFTGKVVAQIKQYSLVQIAHSYLHMIVKGPKIINAIAKATHKPI